MNNCKKAIGSSGREERGEFEKRRNRITVSRIAPPERHKAEHIHMHSVGDQLLSVKNARTIVVASPRRNRRSGEICDSRRADKSRNQGVAAELTISTRRSCCRTSKSNESTQTGVTGAYLLMSTLFPVIRLTLLTTAEVQVFCQKVCAAFDTGAYYVAKAHDEHCLYAFAIASFVL